jgi:hypothetical protein
MLPFVPSVRSVTAALTLGGAAQQKVKVIWF